MGLLQDKFAKYDLPQQFMAKGVYPYFRTINSHQDTEVMMDGKKVLKKGLQVIVPRDAEKDTSNVLQRAQDYINGLKQINDAFVEDIAHKNKMILDKGKRQFKKLTKM